MQNTRLRSRLVRGDHKMMKRILTLLDVLRTREMSVTSIALRRVMHAFGVVARDVRFIATSATIASADGSTARAELKEYVASLAGVPITHVEVVEGRRKSPQLEREYEEGSDTIPPQLEDLLEFPEEERYELLANVNAFAERFVQSIRRECLSKIIPLGEGHLRRTINVYVEHYHEERNHQGLGNRLIEPSVAANGAGPICRRTRLGGLPSFYYREVA